MAATTAQIRVLLDADAGRLYRGTQGSSFYGVLFTQDTDGPRRPRKRVSMRTACALWDAMLIIGTGEMVDPDVELVRPSPTGHAEIARYTERAKLDRPDTVAITLTFTVKAPPQVRDRVTIDDLYEQMVADFDGKEVWPETIEANAFDAEGAYQITGVQQLATCDHCHGILTPDRNRFWVGHDDTADCPASMNGHTVYGNTQRI